MTLWSLTAVFPLFLLIFLDILKLYLFKVDGSSNTSSPDDVTKPEPENLLRKETTFTKLLRKKGVPEQEPGERC